MHKYISSVHKYVSQCTNIFFSAQIYFSVNKRIFQSRNMQLPVHKYKLPVHEYIFQCTNIFFSAQMSFPVHKYISQCTNTFSSAQIHFPVHKRIFQSRNMQLPVHKYKLPVHELMFLSAQIKIDSAQKLKSVHKETGYDGGQVNIVFPRFTAGHLHHKDYHKQT